MAGAGVAIFDPNDCLILEVSKNLEPLMDGRVVTGEVVELSALIVGLNQALTLGLKRLTFLCEDNEIYQYVSLTIALLFHCSTCILSFPVSIIEYCTICTNVCLLLLTTGLIDGFLFDII